MSNMNTHCAITNCKITLFSKPPGVTFHSCPTSTEMRNKWLLMLKNKCSMLDWTKSKICSKHFENKYFDNQRKLGERAIPTLFPLPPVDKSSREEPVHKSKIGKLLCKQSQAELITDVKNSLSKLKEPINLDNFISDDLKCKSDSPIEARLWLMIKKQDHLISRLMDQVSQNRKHVEMLRKNMDASRVSKREMEQNLETMKYIVKSLQEKHASLEEQIEILTAVEAR